MSRPLLADYIRVAGWALVPFSYGLKKPLTVGWQLRENAITDPEIAEYMDGNVGLCHAYSGTCVLDLDDLILARGYLAERGVDVDALLNAPDAVMISSGRENRAKLLYKCPQPLPSFKLNNHGFELRCAASTGNTLQDVLPPSVHPDTGKEYEWKYNDPTAHWSATPDIPPSLSVFWNSLIRPENKLKKPRAERVASLNLGKARELLFRHDPDCGYDDWVRAGMALHHESQGGLDGLHLWDEWSARGEKYQGIEDLLTHWRSFKIDATDPVTVSSLRTDEAATAEDFPELSDSDVLEAMPARAQKELPGSVREVMRELQRDKAGRCFAVLPNILAILSIPEVCGQQLAYDQFKDVLVCAPHGTTLWRPIKDTDYTGVRIYLEQHARFYPVSRELVRDAIHYLAEANKMDSAQVWLSSLQWDGVARVERFMPDYMGTVNAEYERQVGTYLWTALAGRIMEPGCQVDMVPILIGAQGIGKSQGVRAMVPEADYFVEIRLDESDDVIARKLRGAIIGELAELRGLRTTELERVKAFITRTHEKWTPKYMEFATTFPRRLVMIGTSNEDEIFVDDENRRWLPVKTIGVDVDAIKRDRDQLWAEALAMWMDGGVRFGEAQQLARDEQKNFKAHDEWTPLVEQWIANHEDPKVLRTHDVLIQAIGLDIRHVGRVQEQRAARILRDLGYDRKTVRDPVTKKTKKVWIKGLK